MSDGQAAADPLASLLRPPVRLGWEIVPPIAARLSPERNNPPQPAQVRLISAAKAVHLKPVAAIVGAGWLVTLLIYINGQFNGALILVNACAAALAFWGARALHAPDASRGGKRNMVAIVGWTIGSLLAPYIFLLVECLVMLRAAGTWGSRMVPEPGGALAVQRDHAVAVEQWQQRIQEFELAEWRRVQSADLWYPVSPSSSARVICCFGGSPDSWALALMILGGSVLGAGQRVLLLDLSRRNCTEAIQEIARKGGFRLGKVHFPDDAYIPAEERTANLLDGVGWDDLTDIIVEATHASQRDLATSRRERQSDRAVLRDAVGCLVDRSPSIRLLRAALRVIQGADVATNRVSISDDEYDNLSRLYNEMQRQLLMERVIRLDHVLRDLEVLDVRPAAAATGVDAANLELIGIDKQAPELDNELLVDVVFHLLLRTVRRGHARADTVVLLGADRIGRSALENLAAFAERERIRIILFFEHLRDDAVAVVGGGGAAAVFFALSNHHEASEAAAFIGSGYKWVESQRTRSVSESITRTEGRESSQATSFTRSFSGNSSGETSTEGWSFNQALGEGRDFSTSEQRVNELLVDPAVLMGLPVSGCLYVEVRTGGRRRIASVDCNPVIGLAPRVAQVPRDAAG